MSIKGAPGYLHRFYIHDYPALFDRKEYKENIKQDVPIGTNILRVSASYKDVSKNGAITYNLTAPKERSDIEYFSINHESGWIMLKKGLDRYRYHLRAIATDNSFPQLKSSVEIVINVVDRLNNTSVWDQSVNLTSAFNILSYKLLNILVILSVISFSEQMIFY